MRIVPDRRPNVGRIAGFAALLIAVSWALGTFSAWPWAATAPDAALLRVSLRHVSRFSEAARHRTHEEEEAIEKLPRHMRPLDPSRPTTGRRADATLSVVIDGRTALSRTYRPTGLRHDGPIYGYEEVVVTPGRHVVSVTLEDRAGGARELTFTRAIDLSAGHAPLIEYTDGTGWAAE